MSIFHRKSAHVQVVLGTQWGDEGKGKIVDLLGEQADVVARYQGGPNAGHTVEFGNDKFVLHQIPTGILRDSVQCYIGNGLVIHPESLLEEIQTLESKGVKVVQRLFISPNAHLILPHHRLIDRASEEAIFGDKIGTTGRGIGPAYADKANRTGIRIGDLFDNPGWEQKITQHVENKNRILELVYQTESVAPSKVVETLNLFRSKIETCVADIAWKLKEDIQNSKNIIIEGAQGTLLDIDFGTYPYVTSSNTTVGGLFTGLGIGPRSIDRILGVVKAYTTRVGNGPFPTELKGDLGERMRIVGGEFGATTGRPRRCGWFDTVVVRHAIQINGIDELIMTKLDVLDQFKEIQICIGYRFNGRAVDHFPSCVNTLDRVEPFYETVSGWMESITTVRRFKDLPKQAKQYLRRIEELLQRPVKIISVGPKRDSTIRI